MQNPMCIEVSCDAGANSQQDDDCAQRAEQKLEAAADRLLKSAGVLGKRHGTYTSIQLKRKIRLELQRIPKLDECDLARDVLDYLIESRVDDLVGVSGLTPMQEIVFRLRVSGLDCRAMAATLDIKHEVLAGHLRQARWKIRAASGQGRYAGWYEVYLSEVNRSAYRARRTHLTTQTPL